MRERCTAEDCADILKELFEVHFPEAEKIVLVCDNLNRTPLQDIDPATADRLAAYGMRPVLGARPAGAPSLEVTEHRAGVP